MRVVSMVPSWTETLLECGVEVVGRTRFCLHPQNRVTSIPRVGGTKDWKLSRLQALAPDLVVLDREENPRSMAEAGFPTWASHVTAIEGLASQVKELASLLNNSKLAQLAERWTAVETARPTRFGEQGILKWGRRPHSDVHQVVYVIWRDPWMAVGPGTFIASVLSRLGLSVAPSQQRYPEFDPSQWMEPTTLTLFSSEPYPFLRKRHELENWPTPYAFVDGESFSWFGVRSLKFLEDSLFP